MKARIALGALVTTLLAAGCALHPGGGGATAGPVVVVLGDTSCDVSGPLLREARRVLRTAVEATAVRRGTILADRIQAAALETTTFPLRHDFVPSEAVPAGNSTLEDDDLRRQATEVARDVQPVFSRRPGECRTDVFGAVLAAERAFAEFDPARLRVLVLVSNGLVVSEGVDFRRERLGRRRVTLLLTQLRQRGLLPRLDGVHVVLVGLGVDVVGLSLGSRREAELERFWRAYFAATGATVGYVQPSMRPFPWPDDVA